MKIPFNIPFMTGKHSCHNTQVCTADNLVFAASTGSAAHGRQRVPVSMALDELVMVGNAGENMVPIFGELAFPPRLIKTSTLTGRMT
jgi:hypothetical protein